MGKQKTRRRTYIIGAVLTLLILLHLTNVIQPVEQAFISRFLSAQGSVFSRTNSITYSFINYKEAQNLLKENQRLQDIVNELLYKNAALDDLQVENDNLRALLQYQDVTDVEMIVSQVIGKDITRQNTLIVNTGAINGVTLNAPVIVGNGVLVGKVIDVREYTSSVLLLTDPENEVAITIPGHEESIGVASGEFGISVLVELIPNNIAISENDTIITSGLEGHIPRGLVIGRVNRVFEQEGELFKSATVNTIINYDQLTVLSIVKGETN